MTKIYLIGYMASGKSRLGKELSELTGLSFIDLDEVFEERYRIGILDFFEKYGEPVFRQLEHTLLLETKDLDGTIIATGGGTPCYDENIRFIKDNGRSIYIRMGVHDLAERLKQIKRQRPLLKDIPPDELEAYIKTQLEEREFYYLQADRIIEAPVNDLEPVANLIRAISDGSFTS
ncbi:MAG: shikimate kinase [Bacteroidetes bacterium]|nr:shikimate kinase [Bacteroidota bacterium]